jgi:hypothetical protein
VLLPVKKSQEILCMSDSIQIGSPVVLSTSASRQDTVPTAVFVLNRTYNLSFGAIRNRLIDADPEVTASVVFPAVSTAWRFEPTADFRIEAAETELFIMSPTAFLRLNLRPIVETPPGTVVDTPLAGVEVAGLSDELFLCHLFPKTALTATAELQRPNPLRFLERD